MDDASEGANAEENEETKEARLALPLDFKASFDGWRKKFMDEDELPKVGCKPDRPVKGAAHKMVPVEETRRMLRGLSIGAQEVADVECGAEAECADVVPKDADYSKF